MNEISKEQALSCMDRKEFGDDIISSAEHVAVFLTQSWCPEWQAMRRFVADRTDCTVYFLEYDRTDFFDRFRTFKEEVLVNDLIPYIRYYRNGKLSGESNAVSEKDFCKRLGISSR